MKARWEILLVGIVLVSMILFNGYQPVLAAPPAGEVKIVASMFGREIPVPNREISASLDWMDLLYDPLVGCTPEGKLSPDYGLANKWEMSPDGLTWTFDLRKGVKFHDGVEVTAKDVKFSIEQTMLPDATLSEATLLRQSVKSIDVKGPYTLVIHCKKPSIFLCYYLSNIDTPYGMVVPKDYYERLGKDQFAKHPIGSGPYKFHSQVVGSYIKLEATDRHWRDGVPRYKYLTFQIIPEESTQIAMLKTGEADIARISRRALKEALSAGLEVITKEKATVLYFRINMQWTSPAFSDIRFRKALNLAIDKEAIIKQLFEGLAKPIATYPGSNIFGVGGAPMLRPYPYDPEEARRLIKEGGWEGHEFTLISYTKPGCPELPLVVEALAGYWEKIGLKPKIRMIDWVVWLDAWSQQKTQNAIHGADAELGRDVYTLLSRFMENWDFNNKRTAVNISEVNEGFRKIEKSLDIAEISKLMVQIYHYAYDHYLVVPICEFPENLATTKKIPKWNPGLRRIDRNYNDLIRQR